MPKTDVLKKKKKKKNWSQYMVMVILAKGLQMSFKEIYERQSNDPKIILINIKISVTQLIRKSNDSLFLNNLIIHFFLQFQPYQVKNK